MGTTIAGNQHIGTNYQKYQYLWAPGSSGDYGDVELYEENRIFVYQFNPLYDQRDDGEYAIEFYYYYRKPTSEKFYKYCYYADDYYIYPFLAWYDDTTGDGGKWGGIITNDSEKISLVGRESGWIHVTLHVEEAIWGRFTKNGRTYDNTIYIGLYSPIPVFCWDNSVTCEQPLIPYEINWDFSEYEDDTVYDLLTGGYLEDCYDSRQQINDYPSFYITFRDVTPESFAYSVNEASVMNVSSGINKKAVFKKLLSEIQSIVGTSSSHQLHIRNAGNSPVIFDDSFSKRMYFARLFSEKKNVSELLSRKLILRRLFDDVFEALEIKKSSLLLLRKGNDLFITDDSNERTLVWKRQLDVIPDIESELTRSQEVFRAFENSVDVSALPFASRLFYRTVKTVLGFWDWLRGKIREANNVVSFYCPIWDEIEWECKI